MAKKRKPPGPAKLKVGDRVRVKRGIRDVDYPDMPLGGWAGTVTEVCGADTFTIRWSQETLDAIHPVFKNRCGIDGLDPEEYVLTGDDLEPDTGGPLDIEQPTEIKTRPLSPKDQDDRVRMVFGLTSNDPLPDVDDETLETYHDYLSKNLAFPFEAEHTLETGPFSSRTIQVKVIGLGDPEDEPMIDDMYGILCEARHERRVVTLPLGELEVKKTGFAARIVRTPARSAVGRSATVASDGPPKANSSVETARGRRSLGIVTRCPRTALPIGYARHPRQRAIPPSRTPRVRSTATTTSLCSTRRARSIACSARTGTFGSDPRRRASVVRTNLSMPSTTAPAAFASSAVIRRARSSTHWRLPTRLCEPIQAGFFGYAGKPTDRSAGTSLSR